MLPKAKAEGSICASCPLTDGWVWHEGHVLEAEDLGDIVKVGVLNHERPLGVVHAVIEVGDCNLGTPVLLVVDLYMPVDTDRAHVVCALQQR